MIEEEMYMKWDLKMELILIKKLSVNPTPLLKITKNYYRIYSCYIPFTWLHETFSLGSNRTVFKQKVEY